MIKLRREAKIGLFCLLTLGALYWGINYLRGQDLFHRNNTYYGVYDQVNGVQTSSGVFIRGFKVGVINKIDYDPSKSDKFIIEFSVKSKYKLPVDSEARIFSDGILGGKAVEIILGTSDKYLADGEIIQSAQDKDLLEMAGSELEFLKQKASQLVNDISATLATVNGIFADNAESLGKTMDNLAAMSGSLNYVVGSERENMRGVIMNLNALSTTLKNSSENIENIVGNVEGLTDSLRNADFAGVVNNLSSTLERLNHTFDMINDGRGTAGKLVTDAGLYDSLVMATSNLSALLEDLKDNPGRYVQFSVFGRKNK